MGLHDAVTAPLGSTRLRAIGLAIAHPGRTDAASAGASVALGADIAVVADIAVIDRRGHTSAGLRIADPGPARPVELRAFEPRAVATHAQRAELARRARIAIITCRPFGPRDCDTALGDSIAERGLARTHRKIRAIQRRPDPTQPRFTDLVDPARIAIVAGRAVLDAHDVAGPSLASGTATSGTLASGTTASGTTASGTATSGTTASGTTTSGTTASGTATSGTTTSGTTTSGTTTSRSITSGAAASGIATSGATASGFAASGAARSGITASGATASDTTASDTIASDTTASTTTASTTTASTTTASTATASAGVASGRVVSDPSGTSPAGSVRIETSHWRRRCRATPIPDRDKGTSHPGDRVGCPTRSAPGH